MILIPLRQLPNQSITISLNNQNYAISVKDANNTDDALNVLMIISIERNNEEILSGFRAINDIPVIPYEYLQDGNFIFITKNSEYPDYKEFGNTQFLFYLTQAEIEALNES